MGEVVGVDVRIVVGEGVAVEIQGPRIERSCVSSFGVRDRESPVADASFTPIGGGGKGIEKVLAIDFSGIVTASGKVGLSAARGSIE